ncbi:hypothetical protein OESDEN_12552 [Oesophagostomum dentatum]|uniref:Secreted protein n=1 Tax=Oesophagostomum dentatum TaxID=61180 RepID=A0A0B1SUX9_OESDE|nr:hypothetical protein OESDEN_12552 [Oesophagostomum dentatum]
MTSFITTRSFLFLVLLLYPCCSGSEEADYRQDGEAGAEESLVPERCGTARTYNVKRFLLAEKWSSNLHLRRDSTVLLCELQKCDTGEGTPVHPREMARPNQKTSNDTRCYKWSNDYGYKFTGGIHGYKCSHCDSGSDDGGGDDFRSSQANSPQRNRGCQ